MLIGVHIPKTGGTSVRRVLEMHFQHKLHTIYGERPMADEPKIRHAGIRSDGAFSYHLLLKGPYIDAMAIFDRKALIAIGLYNQDMPSYGFEDYELWLRIGKAGKQVVFMDCAPLSFNRIHDSNMGKSIGALPDTGTNL